jgi:hypothetical protein
LRFEIHIEELVLHGFEGADRYAIGEAVSAELRRLIAAGGLTPSPSTTWRSIDRRRPGGLRAVGGQKLGSPALFAQSMHIPSVQAPPAQIAPGALRSERVGAQIASQLYQSLNQPVVKGK